MATKKQKIDWRKELSVDCSKMEIRRAFSLANKADNWLTMPLVHKFVRQDDWGIPEDRQLEELGKRFADTVEQMAYYVQDYRSHKEVRNLTSANKRRIKALGIIDKIDQRIEEIVKGTVKDLQALGYKLVKK